MQEEGIKEIWRQYGSELGLETIVEIGASEFYDYQITIRWNYENKNLFEQSDFQEAVERMKVLDHTGLHDVRFIDKSVLADTERGPMYEYCVLFYADDFNP